jgi:hypothetical protein
MVHDIRKPNSKLAQTLLADRRKAFTSAKAEVVAAKKEFRSAEKALDKAHKGKANPELKGLRFHEINNHRVVDEYGNAYAFPQKYAEPLARYERLVSGDPEEITKFTTALAKWVGAWKVFVTVVDPGYRIRNTMTDFWNMWIAGVPAHQIATNGIRAARLMGRAKRGDPKALEEIASASQTGVFTGMYAGDIAQAAKFIKGGGVKYADAPLSKTRPLKWMMNFNRSAENWGRLTHLMYRRKVLKEDTATAAFRVKEAHFDYEELTDFEQKMKLVFPFYTWTRKNLPYQVKKILTNPGRYSAFPKMAQEAQFASGNPNQPVSDWVEEGFGMPIPGMKDMYFMPQFGVSDLEAINSRKGAMERVKGLLGPHIKIPAEIATGKSLFTNQEIESPNHPRSPISKWGANLLSLLPGNVADVGQTSRMGPGGKQISGPGASPWAAYLLGQLPMTRAAFVTGPGSITAKGAGMDVPPSWLSVLGGLSVTRQDPELVRTFERMDIIEDIDRMLGGLKDSGVLQREARKKSRTDKLIDKARKDYYAGR